MQSGLPTRPEALCALRDLRGLTETSIITLVFARSGEWLRRLYLARQIDATVGPIEMLPRNRREMWPMREVRMTSADGRLYRSALVSLDENGKPLVHVMPAVQATPRQS